MVIVVKAHFQKRILRRTMKTKPKGARATFDITTRVTLTSCDAGDLHRPAWSRAACQGSKEGYGDEGTLRTSRHSTSRVTSSESAVRALCSIVETCARAAARTEPFSSGEDRYQL